MIYTFFQYNYASILICILIVLFLCTNRYFNKRLNCLFFSTVIILLVISVVDSVEFCTSKLEEPTLLRILMSSIGYSLRPIIAYNIILILKDKDFKIDLILFIPIIINFFVSFSAIFSDLMFSYSSANEFIRGPLNLFPFIVAGIYIVIIFYLVIVIYSKGNRYESIIAMAATVAIAMGIILDSSLFKFEGLFNVSCAIGLTFYYLFLHTRVQKRDGLTGAYNRASFYIDTNSRKNLDYWVISLDINDLKIINDTEGHSEGDIAITTVVDVVRSCIPHTYSIYRTGGDEFMIVCEKAEHVQIHRLVKKIKNRIQETKYSCAIGTARHKPNENIEETCKRADKLMYLDKREMKGERRNTDN